MSNDDKRFELKFRCDNAAFDGDLLEEEVARILRALADKIKGGLARPGDPRHQNVMDINGNTVGTFRLY